jgi:hypothetical protein
MNQIVEEIQAVVDRLHSEGHTVATRLENALHGLKKHLTKDKAVDVAEVEADVKQIETDAAPVEAEIKADTAQMAAKVKGQVEADLAEATDVVKK